MPNPKRRYSHSKQGNRRSQRKVKTMQPSLCPRCKEVKLPHRVCVECGYYDNREVFVIAES